MGAAKDDNYNGKFKISVISTGIDSENYYKDIIHKENITKLDNVTNPRIISKDAQTFEQENNQPSFLVDLREPTKPQKNDEDLREEEKIIYEQHPEKNKPKKKTLLGRIFGTNSKDIEENLTKSNPDKEASKEQFIKEFKEITNEKNTEIDEDKEKIVIEDESVRYMPEVDRNSDIQNTENEVEQNDVNDDLLQIPAFLRRQAN